MSPFDRDLHLRSVLSDVHYIDFSVKIFSEVIQATQTTKLLISFILARSPDTFYYHHILTVVLLEAFLSICPTGCNYTISRQKASLFTEGHAIFIILLVVYL